MGVRGVRRPARGLLLALVLVAGLVPGSGSANPVYPTIRSTDPTSVPARSGPLTVQIEGSGFRRARGAPGVRLGSRVYAENRSASAYGNVKTRVINARHIEATIPRRFVRHPGDLWLTVHNGVTAFGGRIPITGSNTAVINVEPTTPPPGDLLLELDIEPEIGAGRCGYLDVSLRDERGRWMSPEGHTYSFASDDLDSPGSNDGDIEFFEGYCDDGSLISGVYEPTDYMNVYVRGPSRGSFGVTVGVEDLDIDATVPLRVLGGWVSGVVTAAGQPVAGAQVFLGSESAGGPSPQFSVVPGSGYGSWCPASAFRSHAPWPEEPWISPPYLWGPIAVTEADGSYRSDTIAPAGYTLYVEAPEGSALSSAWFGDVVDPAATVAIEIGDGQQVQSLDVQLGPGGSLAGRAEDGSDGSPLAGVDVVVVDPASGRSLTGATTNDDGTYRTTGLPAGAYQLFFNSTDLHVSAWLGGARVRSDAQQASVTPGSVTGNVDVALMPGATFSATVRSGAVLDEQIDARFTVYDVESGAPAATAYSSEDEWWDDDTWPGVPPGSYKVRVDPFDKAYPSFWDGDGATTFEDAAAVEIGAGEHIHLDIPAPTGAVFTGSVRGTSPIISGLGLGAEPVEYANVLVWDEDRIAAIGCSDENGSYTTGGLPSGRYKVQFVPPGDLAPTWLGGPDRASAMVVEVERGQRYTADAVVEPGASIEGTLVSSEGGPVGGGFLLYQDGEPEVTAEWSWRTDGAFSFRGLAPGTYRIRALPYTQEDDTYLPDTWYPGAPYRSASEPITVTSVTDQVDASFAAGVTGSIEGTITGLTRFGRYTDLEFLDPSTGEVVDWSWNDRGGAYRATLHAGDYLVRATGTLDRAAEYHGGTSSRAAAVPVSVTAGGVVSGIDIALDAGRSIGGTTYAEHSGARVPGVHVHVLDAGTGEEVTSLDTTYEGIYRTPALAPGVYKVVFLPHDVYADQWWDGRPTFETADPVTLTSSADALGIDVLLAFE